jgi:signal transduction histidine kinase
VRDILEEVAHDCAVEAEMRGCRIQLNGNLCGPVHGNPELLRRAVENVLRNGIRYSPEKSPIEITLSEGNDVAIIAIRDFGPGVPDRLLAQIFDPFFRVEEARNTNGGGSGLGLSIAKRAVHLHHGSIVAENATPGLRVTLAIPLTHAQTLKTA